MDPPYQGVCGNRDTRHLQNLQFCEFVQTLDELNQRGIRYLVSYDGRTGEKTHGKRLPDDLNLTLIELYAGRSSQATLLGRDDVTIESLCLSPSLADELAHVPIVYRILHDYHSVHSQPVDSALTLFIECKPVKFWKT